ncbi:MAG: hypothetical protein NC087_04510 [Anaeroplasma bactoclasticum]|nr:hypothetical protein [Anaeroplasma bactoclasticum]
MSREQEYLNTLKKFVGKRVEIKHFIDHSFRIDGDPQFNPIIYIDGILRYDRYVDRENFTRADYQALEWYGKKTEQYKKTVNVYCYYDTYYSFIVSEVILKMLKKEVEANE